MRCIYGGTHGVTAVLCTYSRYRHRQAGDHARGSGTPSNAENAKRTVQVALPDVHGEVAWGLIGVCACGWVGGCMRCAGGRG